MLPWFRPLRKGQQISAEQYNRMADQVAASANITAAWPLNIETGLHGTHLTIDLPRAVLCRVISAAPVTATSHPPVYTDQRFVAYTVMPVYDQLVADADTEFADDSAEPTFIAFEINSNHFVPVDGTAIVWCVLSEATGYWNFSYESRIVWAEITSCSIESSGYKHAWTEQRRNADGEWEDAPNGLSGTEENNQLVEVNKRGGTRIGTVVLAWRGYSQGRGWVKVAEVSQPPTSTYEVQSVTIYNAAGGTFTLTFNNNVTSTTTTAIPYNCTAAQLKAALDALANIGSVTVTGLGTEASPFLVTFTDAPTAYPLMTVYTDLMRGTQEWLFEQPQTKFYARILSRTASSCGNSGSGSGDTDHTVYTYTIHSVRFVDDGDGCPTAINDEIDVAITGTAYEVNNNSVAVGTVVEVESVTYTDEQVSGSGSNTTGPAGCRLVFKHEAMQSAAPCLTASNTLSTELECDGTHFVVNTYATQFGPDADGCWMITKQKLGSVTTTWCCERCDDESGSGSGSGGGCAGCQQNYCLTMNVSGEATPNCCNAINNISVTLPLLGDCGGQYNLSTWYAQPVYTVNFADGRPAVTVTLYCTLTRFCTGHVFSNSAPTYKWYLNVFEDVDVIGGFNACYAPVIPATGGAALYLGEGSSSTTPPTLSGVINCRDCFFEGTAGTDHAGTFALAVGACAPGSGSGGAGDCPCQWQWTGTPALGAWGLIYSSGECVCGSMPGTNGTYDGEIRNTECNGAECDPGGGGGAGPACGSCGTASRTATVSAGTGFLASPGGPTFPLTTVEQGGITYWASSPPYVQTSCGALAGIIFWCENDRWYCALQNAGFAFEAEAGNTCSSMTFKLSYGTNNILCPGLSGSLTITVTV